MSELSARLGYTTNDTTKDHQPPPGMDKHLVTLYRPASWEAERYRMLRRAIERSYQPERRRVIAVTSATAGEGKTTTAVNLAAVLSEIPRTSVLLVDADFRCSSVARVLGHRVAPPDLGQALLNPELTLNEVVRRAPHGARFHVAPSMPCRSLAHEMVDSPRLVELLTVARNTYDYVVVDAPPLLPVADCKGIARCIDGFLLVVAAERTSRRLLGEALGSMEPQKLLGFVLNDAEEPVWVGNSRYYLKYGPLP
jgi:capsular exopolysaccharide synthesis family protein